MDEAEVTALKSLGEDDRVEYVQEELEERLWSADPSRVQETDKAWDAIHRALTDGGLAWDNGEYPLNHAILGGEILYTEEDHILSLKSPRQVREVAVALRDVTRESLRAGYRNINPGAYGFPPGDEDFDYTWHWFEPLVSFYQRAAEAGRAVLFTADQ